MNRVALLVLGLLWSFAGARGQLIVIRPPKRDTGYIKSFYRKYITVRAFESNKFNNFQFTDGGQHLIYKPNDHINVGVGAHYKFISLNLGIYMPFLDKNNDVYGKTRQLDLQTHVFMRKFIVDFYGQFYKGYYLANSDAAIYNNPPDKVAVRPDIGTRYLALVAQYAFNGERFSYNAPFFQNEVQKKSAGSMLLGGGIYHTHIAGDSSLIPANIRYSNFYDQHDFSKASNVAAAFSMGYAYTFVIRKHFFITGALSGGAGVNYATLTDTAGLHNHRFGHELNVTQRLAFGYNSYEYFAGINYIRLTTEGNGPERGATQQVNSGNFRLVLAKRFLFRKTVIPKTKLLEVE